MNSYPSPGDAIPRLLKEMQRELKRLAVRDAQLAKKIAALEVRVEELENP